MSAEREIPAENSVKVVCRFRPLNDREENAGSKFIVKFQSNQENCFSIADKAYYFDKVFQPNASQEKVYNEAAKSIVTDVLAGYNATIFAYGQTSSGKTHTMEDVIGDPTKQGIIPRIVNDIFNHMEMNLKFNIKVSYYEIYMDKIRDLLDVTKINLSVHEDKNRVPYVKGATERFVSSPEEVFEAIKEGKSNRRVAATNMNEHSSRSHSVFLLHVEQENSAKQKISSKLNLLDLGRTERVSKTGAEGTTLKDASSTNKSLSTLSNVISALADVSKSHIPFYDSKLTTILKESLAGNTRTTIIICCSPASLHESETKLALDFGKKAKTSKNAVSVPIREEDEELFGAEDYKRLYEREKEKSARMEAELAKWRARETRYTEEQAHLQEESVDAPVPVTASSITMIGSISVDERMNVDKLEEEILNQEANARRDYENLQAEMTRVKQQNESAKEEVKKVLQALEDLTVNYDQKSHEIETKNKEMENMSVELLQNQTLLNTTSSELTQLRDMSAQQKKRINEMLSNLLRDLNDVGQALSTDSNTDIKINATDVTTGKVEEEFTVARLFISKMKSEAKNLAQRCHNLESHQTDSNKKVSEYERDLSECRLLISQHEARMKSLQESMMESQNKEKEEKEKAEQLRSMFVGQMDELRVAHTKQVAELRDEISEKQEAINELKDTTTSELEHEKKRINDMLKALLHDLNDVAQVMKTEINAITTGDVDVAFTVARLIISKMKSDGKNMVSKYERDLIEYQLLISQHEARMKSLQESMRESQNKEKEEKEKAEQLRSMFVGQMDELRVAHTKQVAELRDEISEKQEAINDLNQKLALTHQQMPADYEKLRQEETSKSSKLQELTQLNENREQARKDPQGLEDEDLFDGEMVELDASSLLLADDSGVEFEERKVLDYKFPIDNPESGELEFLEKVLGNEAVKTGMVAQFSTVNPSEYKEMVRIIIKSLFSPDFLLYYSMEGKFTKEPFDKYVNTLSLIYIATNSRRATILASVQEKQND